MIYIGRHKLVILRRTAIDYNVLCKMDVRCYTCVEDEDTSDSQL